MIKVAHYFRECIGLSAAVVQVLSSIHLSDDTDRKVHTGCKRKGCLVDFLSPLSGRFTPELSSNVRWDIKDVTQSRKPKSYIIAHGHITSTSHQAKVEKSFKH